MSRDSGAHAGDPIGEYLDMIRSRLRAAPREAGRIVAEAEDHLREAVADGMAAGLTEREAQEAAISSFGSVNAVARAHNARLRRLPALAGDLVLRAWQLGSVFLLAVGASGLVAAAMDAVLGRSFVGAAPPGTRFAAADCRYWLGIWPDAHTCAQAAMLESSSDNVVLRVTAGVFGLALLAACYLARRWLRHCSREPAALPGAFVPAAAVFFFGAACVGLSWLTVNRLAGSHAILGLTGGPGSFLSGAIVMLAAAAAYLLALRRTLRGTPRETPRYHAPPG